MKRKMTAGSTSQAMPIFILDSSSTVGAGLSGLVYNTGSLVAEYRRQGQSAWTPIALAAVTLGTYTSGGFVADGSLAGSYEIGIPDAALAVATGATWVVVRLYGATNMIPVVMEIELDVLNYQGNVASDVQTIKTQTVTCAAGVSISPNVGFTYVPQQDSGGYMKLSVGTGTGQVALTAGAVTVGTNNDKTGYSLAASQSFSTSGAVGSVTGLTTTAIASAILASPTHPVQTDSSGSVLVSLSQSIPMTGNAANSIADCLNAARAQGFGKWVLTGTTLTLYGADGSTIVRSFTLDSATSPTQRT